MQTIITATDFSEVAENAVRYACSLAASVNASVTVVHSYIIPVTFNDNPMPVMPIDEGRTIAEEQMTTLLSKLRAQHPDQNINGHVTLGDITDSLVEFTAKVQPWMIVIGNSSNEDYSMWPGSNLISELRNLEHSVLAISPNAQFQSVKKICFACDFKNIRKDLPTTKLLELVKSMNAELHVLNVDHDNENFGLEMPVEATALHELLASANPQFHYTNNDDIEEGINNFVMENNMDWLVVMPHKHSFFESLFHKSHTKAIVRKVHIPIVALH